MQPQMQPLRLCPLGRPSPVGATIGAGCVSDGPRPLRTRPLPAKTGAGGLVAGSDARGLKVCCSECRVVPGNGG
jgi:hypothetical protein